MTSGDYESYSVDDLYEIIMADDPDAMETQAQSWSNSAGLFKAEYDNLVTHLATIEGKWTSAAATPYLNAIEYTMKSIRAAWKNADAKAEGWSGMAGYTRWAQERVTEQYEEWQEAKKAAGAKYDQEKSDYDSSMLDFTAPEEPKYAALRKPFDEQSRTYMDVAADYHRSQAPKIVQAMPPLRVFGEGGPVVEDPNWDLEDVGNIDWTGGGPGSYAEDSSGIAAVSSAGPSLQGGVAPGTTTPTPGIPGHVPAGPPPGGFGGVPPMGTPVGGLSPIGGNPTPPVVRPTPAATNRTFGPAAARTPNLPGTRPGGIPGRQGIAARPGTGTPGRPGTGGPQSGRRALPKSRMAPTDRTGRVRTPGEAIGGRGRTGKPQPGTGKPPVPRRVQPPVIGARGQSGKPSVKPPVDRTKLGYSRQVIGQQTRVSSDFSRTPQVSKQFHDPGKAFGKRQDPASADQERRQRIADRKDRRDGKQRNPDGLSRPVIGNGVNSPEQLPAAEPTPREAVRSQEPFWRSGLPVTRAVIGNPRPEVDYDHDPGPVFTGRSVVNPEAGHHDPGPTAFGTDREPPRLNWS